MTKDQLLLKLKSLSAEKIIEFLAVLSHNITVVARDCYTLADELPSPSAFQRLIGFNELLHQISGQQMHSFPDSPQGYPLEGFVGVVFSVAHSHAVEPDLNTAIHFTARHF